MYSCIGHPLESQSGSPQELKILPGILTAEKSLLQLFEIGLMTGKLKPDLLVAAVQKQNRAAVARPIEIIGKRDKKCFLAIYQQRILFLRYDGDIFAAFGHGC